jgi:maltooligosyltrehalose trehalohydrolase
MWLRDYHFDGLRLDAVHAIVDTSAVHFLEELELKVEALAADVGRPLHLIAESAANDPRLVWDRAHGGYGLAATWSDDLHHALHSVLTGERTGYYCDYGSLQDVAMALRHAYVYAGRFSKFRRKTYGRPADGLSGARFLTYVQNHDQVGNRARGDRISHLVGRGRLKIAAALVLTSPFVPLIFMGEEWASSTPFPFFVSHTDRAVAQGATKGRRREFEAFGWKAEDVPDPMDPATFESAKLRWDELAQDEHTDIYEFYRALLRLRRDEGLCAGDMASVRVDADDATGRLVVRRGRVAIACNLGAATLEPGIEGEVLLASEPEATSRSLPTDAVVVVRA